MTISLAAISFAFAQGLISSLSACVYPLIPITTALFTTGHVKRWWHGFLLSGVYVIGMAVTYVSLGLVAALGGSVFGAWLAQPAAVIVFSLIFVYMGLAFAGILPLPLPNMANHLHTERKRGLLYPLVMGIFSGFIAAPCTAPLFGTLLIDIAQRAAKQESILPGIILATSFSLGMGLPFLAIGGFAMKLPKPGKWLQAIKYIGATVLLAAAFHYLEDIFGPFPPQRYLLGFAAVGLFLAVTFYFLADPFSSDDAIDKPGKVAATAFLLVAGFGVFLASSPISSRSALPANTVQQGGWHSDLQSAFQAAEKKQGPVVIDFWAEWCEACHEMEAKLFPSPEFQALVKEFNVTLARLDFTEMNDESNEIATRYAIRGLPTLVIANPEGKMFGQVIGFHSKELALKELRMNLQDYHQ
ncbi:MAG: thioredoxin family protein [Leptospiraceae bacterium]|nr:thioredoxin family protein [Leptospiraceae bacterium]